MSISTNISIILKHENIALLGLESADEAALLNPVYGGDGGGVQHVPGTDGKVHLLVKSLSHSSTDQRYSN